MYNKLSGYLDYMFVLFKMMRYSYTSRLLLSVYLPFGFLQYTKRLNMMSAEFVTFRNNEVGCANSLSDYNRV